jgi:hypothetical protein
MIPENSSWPSETIQQPMSFTEDAVGQKVSPSLVFLTSSFKQLLFSPNLSEILKG